MTRVLVTGGSGFIGSQCLLQLLAAGHEARATVRTLERQGEVRSMLAQGGAADAGERLGFVAGDFASMLEIAKALKAGLGEAARRVPTRELPDWLVRLVSVIDPTVRQILPELGKRKNATNAKARRLLGWAQRSNAEAIVATGRSLVELGLLKG